MVKVETTARRLLTAPRPNEVPPPKEQAYMSKRASAGPWHREDLVTNNFPIEKIPNLYRSDDYGIPEVVAKMQAMTKESYAHEEIFGQYCHLGQYIHCPVDMAFEYAANVYSLEEWTFSIRKLEPLGGGLYKGLENLAPDTYIYIRSEAYPDSRVVDYPCAWDQGDELWMRYYFRFIDAMPTLRKPGTVVLWTNCKHPYYDRKTENLPPYISQPRAREDRPWVGDIWPTFDAIHRIEIDHIKRILEYRYSEGLSAQAPLKPAAKGSKAAKTAKKKK